jgi:hypothetical protein
MDRTGAPGAASRFAESARRYIALLDEATLLEVAPEPASFVAQVRRCLAELYARGLDLPLGAPIDAADFECDRDGVFRGLGRILPSDLYWEVDPMPPMAGPPTPTLGT